MIKDPFACSQIIVTKLAKNEAAHGLIKNIGPGWSRNEQMREGAGINRLTQVTRSQNTGESRYCFLNIALVKILRILVKRLICQISRRSLPPKLIPYSFFCTSSKGTVSPNASAKQEPSHSLRARFRSWRSFTGGYLSASSISYNVFTLSAASFTSISVTIPAIIIGFHCTAMKAMTPMIVLP